MNKQLRKLVREALTCDVNCGHDLKNINTCFNHQVQRVEELILNEKRKLLEKFEAIISKEWDK